MMEEVSDLELTEMDTSNDMEDIEGDMDDFPEEWMVLDDADDIEATEVHCNQTSQPDNSSKNTNTSAENRSLLKTDTVTLKIENVPKSDKQFSGQLSEKQPTVKQSSAVSKPSATKPAVGASNLATIPTSKSETETSGTPKLGEIVQADIKPTTQTAKKPVVAGGVAKTPKQAQAALITSKPVVVMPQKPQTAKGGGAGSELLKTSSAITKLTVTMPVILKTKDTTATSKPAMETAATPEQSETTAATTKSAVAVNLAAATSKPAVETAATPEKTEATTAITKSAVAVKPTTAAPKPAVVKSVEAIVTTPKSTKTVGAGSESKEAVATTTQSASTPATVTKLAATPPATSKTAKATTAAAKPAVARPTTPKSEGTKFTTLKSTEEVASTSTQIPTSTQTAAKSTSTKPTSTQTTIKPTSTQMVTKPTSTQTAAKPTSTQTVAKPSTQSAATSMQTSAKPTSTHVTAKPVPTQTAEKPAFTPAAAKLTPTQAVTTAKSAQTAAMPTSVQVSAEAAAKPPKSAQAGAKLEEAALKQLSPGSSKTPALVPKSAATISKGETSASPTPNSVQPKPIVQSKPNVQTKSASLIKPCATKVLSGSQIVPSHPPSADNTVVTEDSPLQTHEKSVVQARPDAKAEGESQTCVEKMDVDSQLCPNNKLKTRAPVLLSDTKDTQKSCSPVSVSAAISNPSDTGKPELRAPPGAKVTETQVKNPEASEGPEFGSQSGISSQHLGGNKGHSKELEKDKQEKKGSFGHSSSMFKGLGTRNTSSERGRERARSKVSENDNSDRRSRGSRSPGRDRNQQDESEVSERKGDKREDRRSVGSFENKQGDRLNKTEKSSSSFTKRSNAASKSDTELNKESSLLKKSDLGTAVLKDESAKIGKSSSVSDTTKTGDASKKHSTTTREEKAKQPTKELGAAEPQVPVLPIAEVKKLEEEFVSKFFELKSSAMEQGLWRFAVQISPLEFADLAQESVQTFLNGAQDCAIYMRSNVRGKKKKGDAKMFFPRLQAAKLSMEKVFQLVLVSKKVDLEITRKLLDSSKKDTVLIALDLLDAETLSQKATATLKGTAKDGSSSGDDKNVHISSVPKGTTQELLLLTFPTSHAIRMPREGSDNGSVVIEYSNANQAKDIVRSYISVSINKVKLRLTWNGLSREKLPVPPPKKVDGKVFQIPVRDGWREGKTKSHDRRESHELKELFGNAPGGATETNTFINENKESSNIQELSRGQGNQKVQTPPTSQESKVGDVAGRTLKPLSFSPRSGEGCHDRKQEEEGGQSVRQEGTDLVEGTEVISPDWERDHPDRESISPDWDDSPNKEDTQCQKQTSEHQRLARDDIQQSRVRQRQGRHSDKASGRTGRNAQSDKGLHKDARDLELSRRDSRRPSSDATRDALRDSYQSGKRSREEGDYSRMRSTDQRAGTSMAHRSENSVYSQRRPSPLQSTPRYSRSPRHSPKRLRRSLSPPRHRTGPHLSRSPLAKHRSSISPTRILPDRLRSVSPIRPSAGHDNRSRSPAKQRAPKTFTPEREVRDAKLLAQMLLKSLSPSRSSQPPKEKEDWNAGQLSGFQRSGWNLVSSGDQKSVLSSQSTPVTHGPLFPIGLPSASHPVTAGSFIAAKGPASTSGNSSLQKIPGLDLAVAEDMRTRGQDRFLEQVQSLSRPEEKLPQFMAGGVSEGVLYGTANEAFRQKPDLQKKGTSSSFGAREEPFRPTYQPDTQKTSWANKLDAVQTWPLSDKSQITAISEPTSERTLTPKTGLSSNALAGRDLMVLRQEAARHLASLEKSAGGAKQDEGRQDLRAPLRAETSGNAVVMDYGHQSRKREAEQKPMDVPLKRIRDEGFGKDIMSVGNQDSMVGGSKNQQNLGGAWSRDDSRTGLGGIQMPWKALVHGSEGSGLGPSPSVRGFESVGHGGQLGQALNVPGLGPTPVRGFDGPGLQPPPVRGFDGPGLQPPPVRGFDGPGLQPPPGRIIDRSGFGASAGRGVEGPAFMSLAGRGPDGPGLGRGRASEGSGLGPQQGQGKDGPGRGPQSGKGLEGSSFPQTPGRGPDGTMLGPQVVRDPNRPGQPGQGLQSRQGPGLGHPPGLGPDGSEQGPMQGRGPGRPGFGLPSWQSRDGAEFGHGPGSVSQGMKSMLGPGLQNRDMGMQQDVARFNSGGYSGPSPMSGGGPSLGGGPVKGPERRDWGQNKPMGAGWAQDVGQGRLMEGSRNWDKQDKEGGWDRGGEGYWLDKKVMGAMQQHPPVPPGPLQGQLNSPWMAPPPRPPVQLTGQPGPGSVLHPFYPGPM